MLQLTIDDKPLVPVRLVPFVTGWKFSPDELARILANKEGFHRVQMPSYHLQPHGTHHPILAKEWDTILADLEILTSTLKAQENVDFENYPRWREDSIKTLPTATFVWLEDLEEAWSTAYSEERITLPHERPGDRSLNLYPLIPEKLNQYIYEGFEYLQSISPPHDFMPGTTIRFEELHHFLTIDPFYGVQSAATESLINDIYRGNTTNTLYKQFQHRFSLLPCKGDKQRELIYLWFGLIGMPAYRNGSPLGWRREDFLDNWTQDFEIRLDELKEFLRQHSWPLPLKLFPNDIDNTNRKVAMDREEYDRAFNEFAVRLPKLQEELEEIKRIQPESMDALETKKNTIEKIEQQIAAIYIGNSMDEHETPDERKQRLEAWYQEERSHKGERGALTRTAKREGIARQTLSDILNRR